MKLEKEIISADLEKLKSTSVQISQTIDLLEKRFLEGIEMAEKNNEMSLVISGNCLKRKSIEIKSNLKLLLKEYEKLKEKNKEIIVILKAGIYDLYLVFFFEYEGIVFCCFLDFLAAFCGFLSFDSPPQIKQDKSEPKFRN